MNKLPKISIITPSYNQANFIEETILSVTNQNYPNFEYIVIDGASQDQSLKIIKKYKKKFKYFESKKDHGQSHAINKGFAKSNGEIMTWINSDDILNPGALKLAANIFAQFPEIEWLTGLPSTISQEGYQVYLAQPPLYIRALIKKGLYTRKMLGFIMQEGTFWRRSLWEKIGGKLDEVPYSMDMRLWKKFAKFTPLYCVETCLASYRLNPHRKNNDNHQKYYQEINDRWPKNLAILIKFFWRQIAKIAHHSKLKPSIYYDQNKSCWKFRKNLFKIKTFKLLS